jgi:uncharacterized protein
VDAGSGVDAESRVMAEEDREHRDAGALRPWLDATRRSLRVRADAEVPCGTCTACCTSSQFVHIAPDEVDTLAHVPPALRFPAPGLPRGHVLLPYDERGHCPMLVDGACSIYEHRPRTCRTYDCRIFAATGMLPDEASKTAMAATASRWRFSVATGEEQHALDAMQAAGRFLRARPALLQEAGIPENATQLAVTAVAIHETFVERSPADADVRAALRAWTRGSS